MQRVAVATSGGRDSTALLHCTLRQAQEAGVEVLALHVHHGLLPQADDWLLQVERQARRWGARFDFRRLSGEPARGQSVEAWARIERYRSLAEMAVQAQCGVVLLAHHQRDQAETFLLQALRGAGSAGLAAMPAQAQRQGIVWARPWLEQPVRAIEAYVRRHHIRHVEDPSNADPRFARSRLRQTVWPALRAAFGDADTALAAAAARAQDSLALAQDVAAADLPLLLDGAALKLAAWQALSPPRRLNALRAWLLLHSGAPPPQSLLTRLLTELQSTRTGSWPLAGAVLRRYRGTLQVQDLEPSAVQPDSQWLDLSQPGRHAMPAWSGHWDTQPVSAGGLAAETLTHVRAHARSGGERFRLQARGLPRSLKKQFQSCAVPAWQRWGPLLSTPDGQLLFVPGLGVDAGAVAPQGTSQLQLRWVPDSPAAAGPHRRDG